MSDNPLGKQTEYPQQYAPEVLFAVPRADNRAQIGITGSELPFSGFDHWRAYELSWLSSSGKPVVAVADILVPCDSPNLIESKSMKLYFNSLNQKKFADMNAAATRIALDLGEVAGALVQVRLYPCDDALMHTADLSGGVLLDKLDVEVTHYQPSPDLLKTGSGIVDEILYSHLFRSNCPITAQPDWGSIVVRYRGRCIDHPALLAYLISYRLHEGFHEHCVEQMFQDILRVCKPDSLTVSINFLRRGGLEINPLRSSEPDVVMEALPRLLRQ